MRKLTVIVIGMLLLAALVVAFLTGQFSPERQRERALRRFSEDGTVVRRSCGLGEVHVDGARWQDLSARDRERAAAAIASWCAEQGGPETLTVFDANTRAVLVRWNGTSFEPKN